MRLALSLAMIAACAGDRGVARVEPPVTQIADAAQPEASNDAIAEVGNGADAEAPRVEIPEAVRGELFVAFRDTSDAVHIHTTTIGVNGATQLRRLTSAPGVEDAPMVVT